MASSSTYFEQKRRYLLNLYPDLEDFEQGCEQHDEHEGDLEASSVTAKSDGTADSTGSMSTTGQQEEEDLRNSQRPRRPFWVPNTATTKSKMSSKTKRKKDELPSASSDASPRGLRPDGCCDEDEEKRTVRFYKIVAISLVLLVGMLIAIVLLSLRLVARKESSDDDASGGPDQIRVYEPSNNSNNIFESTACDISNVESICSRPDDGDHRAGLELSEIPKCVQDNFNLVYVRAGHDAYYQLHSIDDLKSCSNEGMALKRLAAMEHEESTTGMLSCQYTAYTWYYKFGQVEWWTADGAAQTSICDDQADVVVCTTANDSTSMSRTVKAFIIETGEECILSELSL